MSAAEPAAESAADSVAVSHADIEEAPLIKK
jgi:hypothetical protein